MWIDTHCHLDAPELALWPLGEAGSASEASETPFPPENTHIVQYSRHFSAIQNIAFCIIPAVQVGGFAAVQGLAHAMGFGYALGIHPLYVQSAQAHDLHQTAAALAANAQDPRLLAVGEIGLDFFVPALTQEPLRSQQIHFYREQLKLAKTLGLPAVLHVRRSADVLLKHLRQIAVPGGIAHAFTGSLQQAHQF